MTIVREETIGDCRLIQADARRMAPNLHGVDAIITDPVWPNAPDGMFCDVDDPKTLATDVLGQMTAHRVAVIMRTDSDPRFLKCVPKRWRFVRTQTLEYASPGWIGRVLGGMEIVYGFGAPIASRPGQRVIPGNAPKAQPSRVKYDHPCARNLGHMQFVVRWWSEYGETVCDPFMGSGTTGVACAKLGRSFIGIEIDPGYFDIACERIREAYRQPDMFTQPAAPKAEQIDLEGLK